MLVAPCDQCVDILFGEVFVIIEAAVTDTAADNGEVIQTIADAAAGLRLPGACGDGSLHVLSGVDQFIPQAFHFLGFGIAFPSLLELALCL